MRYLAIGDIHGCFKALTTLAEFVPFQHDDVLITLGDYVDRGPDSSAVIEWLIDWNRQGKLVALRGNHEVMMLQARESEEACKEWLLCGGDATLASYASRGDPGTIADVPDSHGNSWRRRLGPGSKQIRISSYMRMPTPIARSLTSPISCCIGSRSTILRRMNRERSWCAATRHRSLVRR